MVELTPEEAIALLRTDEEKMRALEGQIQQLMVALNEIKLSKASLELIPKDPENSLVPIGAGVFLPVKAGTETVNVEVGAGVVLEETIEEAQALLDKREEDVNKNITEVNNELEKTVNRAQKLSDKIRQHMQRRPQGDVPVIG